MRLHAFTLAILAGFVPLFGHSTSVVDFENVVGGPGTTAMGPNQYFLPNGGDFVSDGFEFHVNGQNSHVTSLQMCSPLCTLNGTNVFIGSLGPTALTMSKLGGGVFHLQNFDGAGNFAAYFGPQQINVVGTVYGGGTVSQTFGIDPTINASGTLNFTSNILDRVTFSNLTSVTFSSSGALYAIYNGFAIDNITFAATAAIPEPASFALLLAGLSVIGAAGLGRNWRA